MPMSQRSPPPRLHCDVVTHVRQPVAWSRHVSTAPLAPQRIAPSVHVVAQATQLPPTHWLFVGQLCPGPQTGQLFASVPQVSMPFPLQRMVPVVHEVPQAPHVPPEQKVLHVWLKLHEVQPIALATQVSTLRPVQRVEPAVHVLLHDAQLPLVHTLPDGQVRCDHCVQPDNTLHWHSSTPVAVQRLAPMEQPWQVPHVLPLQTSP